jgi:hypothetical protein
LGVLLGCTRADPFEGYLVLLLLDHRLDLGLTRGLGRLLTRARFRFGGRSIRAPPLPKGSPPIDVGKVKVAREGVERHGSRLPLDLVPWGIWRRMG